MNPPSSIHVVPVISPLPFCENHAAKTGSLDSLPRGRTTVTPVRTGLGLTPLPANDRRQADLDAANVGDRVERTGRAVERNAEVARARLGLRRDATDRREQDHRSATGSFMPRIMRQVDLLRYRIG